MGQRVASAKSKGIDLFRSEEELLFLFKAYVDIFEELVCRKQFYFEDMCWDDHEVESLLSVLHHCEVLEELTFDKNPLSDTIIDRFAATLAGLSNLHNLSLRY